MHYFLVLFVLLVAMPPSHAQYLHPQPTHQNDAAQEAIFKKIFPNIEYDLNSDLPQHIREVAQPHALTPNSPTKNKNSILWGDEMTPETQAVMLRGIYLVLKSSLTQYGIPFDEATFNHNIGRILAFSSKLGVFPRAITVGYTARVQAGIGGSFGTQFNFYFEKGKLKIASYTMLGASAGIAEMVKLEFYAGLCFGNACVGGDPVGYYVGLDGYAGLGLGGDFFAEMGVDLQDMMKASLLGTQYSIKDIYTAKIFYIGFGIDVGEGAGVSGNLYRYSEDFEKTLADPSKGIDPSVISNLRLK